MVAFAAKWWKQMGNVGRQQTIDVLRTKVEVGQQRELGGIERGSYR